MLRFILTFMLLSTCFFSFSQTEIIRKSDKQFPVPGNDFAFIEAATDTNTLEFVATFKSDVKASEGIQAAYFSIQEQAGKIGANTFRLNHYSRNDSSNTLTLILDTYYGSDSAKMVNFNHHEETAFIIFGDENPNGEKTYSFKVNGKKKEFKSGTYFKYILKEGEQVKINKGGISGMSIWFNYEKGSKATHLTMTGLGLGGGPVPGDVVGIAVNTGRFRHVPGDLGCLLKNILKQSE